MRVQRRGRTLPGIDKKLVVKIVGIVHKPAILAADTQTIYLPIETMQTFLGKPRAINRIAVTLRPRTDAISFKDQWEQKLSVNNPPLKMKSARDLRKQMEQNLSSVRFLSYMGGTVSMLAATFIVFSALSMGVGERTRTLAMLRAVGMFKGQIARLVFAEGFINIFDLDHSIKRVITRSANKTITQLYTTPLVADCPTSNAPPEV